MFADYSGQHGAQQQRNSIAVFTAIENNPPVLETNNGNGFTRTELRQFIQAFLSSATRDGVRAIVGTDHQWSWPLAMWTTANIIEGAWRQRLAQLVNGAPPRPELDIGVPTTHFAPAFNQFASGDTHTGPFYIAMGNGQYVGHGIPAGWKSLRRRFRLTELDAGTGYCASEFGRNRVAGQTLRGLPQLHMLIESCQNQGVPLACWPFDGLSIELPHYAEKHIGVEVYPSLYPAEGWAEAQLNGGEDNPNQRDAWRSCRHVQSLDQMEQLGDVLNLGEMPEDLVSIVSIEGWILGVEPFLNQ